MIRTPPTYYARIERRLVRSFSWPGLASALLAGLPAEAVNCPVGTLTAVTFVRDGDTIEVGGMPIRLNGLAARG